MREEAMNVRLTTGSSFEGYEIVEYLGFVSGQIALGSSFLSNITEMTAQESTTFTNKLQHASDTALDKLCKAANKMGADAIVGVALNYTEFASSSIGTVASGTAVKLRKVEKKKAITNNLYVSNYYTRMVPRAVQVRFEAMDGVVKIATDFYNYNLDEVKAIRVDVALTNFYDEKVVLQGLDFTFEKNNITFLEADFVDCKLEEKYIKMLKDAKVTIQKYVTSKGVYACTDTPIDVSLSPQSFAALKKKRGIDAFEKFKSDGSTWTCNCGHINGAGAEECSVCQRKEANLKSNMSFDYEAMIEKMKTKSNVTEIKDVFMENRQYIDSGIRMELLEIMESGLQYEKTRGDMTATVIEKIEQVFDVN